MHDKRFDLLPLPLIISIKNLLPLKHKHKDESMTVYQWTSG